MKPITHENYIMPDEPKRFTPVEMDRLLTLSSKWGTSDITVQTGHPVFVEIHGCLYKSTRRELSNTEVGEVLNGIYGPNGTTQILSGHDVDTHYEIRPTRSERYRYRVNATGCQIEGHDGIQLTLRTIPSEPPTLASLKLPQAILDAIAPEEGLVYVTGATGSGKSTLLAAIIRELAERQNSNRKILTYESPIEFVFDSIQMPSSIVSQSEIPRHIANFALGVRNSLRRNPRLILVGEARDPETISAALEAALTGHPVYTTLHTNGVAETIRRLVTSFPQEERFGRTVDILETIRLVIWQKLVPSQDGTRVALREYLVFNEKVRDILLDSDLNNVTAKTREILKEHGQLMIQDAAKHYEAGIISERVFKILSTGHHQAEKDSGVDENL